MVCKAKRSSQSHQNNILDSMSGQKWSIQSILHFLLSSFLMGCETRPSKAPRRQFRAAIIRDTFAMPRELISVYYSTLEEDTTMARTKVDGDGKDC